MFGLLVNVQNNPEPSAFSRFWSIERSASVRICVSGIVDARNHQLSSFLETTCKPQSSSRTTATVSAQVSRERRRVESVFPV